MLNKEVAALLLSIFVNDPAIEESIRAKDTFWYDAKSMPSLYQREGLVFHKTHNREQNANNEKPWNKPAGTDDCENLRSIKFLRLPEGKKIVYWGVRKAKKGADPDEHVTVVWAFPPGTVVGELLIDPKLGLFEIRTRTRSKYDWDSKFFRSTRKSASGARIFEWDNLDAATPKGFVQSESSCIECHKDTGVDQSYLAGALRSQWIGKIRGSDGIFSWHPFVAPKPGFSREPIINEELEHMLRPRREDEAFPFAVKWLTY